MTTGSSATPSPRPDVAAGTPSDASSLEEWLAAGPFTLSLSAGFFGFFAHTGLLMALEERGLTPARITGASAGALAGAIWASGRDANDIRDHLFALRRTDFWDPSIGPGLLRGARFRALLERLLQVDRFEDCRTPLAISGYELLRRQTRVFERGELAPAVHASCAVPFLFRPVRHDGCWLVDGGVADRAAMAAVSDGERVLYHHIASRSPWRRRNSPALAVPRRQQLVALILRGLPRSGPNRLEKGQQALREARAAARLSLDTRPVGGRVERNLRPTGER